MWHCFLRQKAAAQDNWGALKTTMTDVTVLTTAAPIMARVPDAVRQAGLSRASLYREAAAGTIRMVKYGRTSLVDMDSLRRFLSALPARLPRQKSS